MTDQDPAKTYELASFFICLCSKCLTDQYLILSIEYEINPDFEKKALRVQLFTNQYSFNLYKKGV